MAFIVGITGASGSGKSTLAAALAARLGPERAVFIAQDHYYRDLGHLPEEERCRIDFDDPAALELDRLAAHLGELRAGKAVDRPIYDFTIHTRVRDRRERVAPLPLVVVEGLFLGWHEGVRAALDLLVFVAASPAERFRRRLARDRAQRGRSRASVERQWRTQVEPAACRYILPCREAADLVVDGEGALAEGVAAVLARLPAAE